MEIQTIEGVGLDPSLKEMLSVVNSDGTTDLSLDPNLEAETVVRLYRAMLRTRMLDDRLAALSNEIGFHPSAAGFEAALIGAAGALRMADWIFASPRDVAAAMLRGMSLRDYLAHIFATAQDRAKGRARPGHFTARDQKMVPVGAANANHLTHAVGFAKAADYRGEDVATAAFFDAVEVDAAEFHSALNFAGVMRTPTVFLCRTRKGQESAVKHCIAYGLRGTRCNGGDLLAVYRAVRDAIDRASRGGGATVIDLCLDDEDGLELTQLYLKRLGAWTDSDEDNERKRFDDDFRAALDEARAADVPALRTLFEDVYMTPPWHLSEQSAEASRHR